jgi:Mrp family chromosome partitioning ATPase
MANLMGIPVLGLVENYSYLACPDCGKHISVFGESNIDNVAEQFGYKVLAKLPIDPKLAALCDNGLIEEMEADYLDAAADYIENLAK